MKWKSYKQTPCPVSTSTPLVILHSGATSRLSSLLLAVGQLWSVYDDGHIWPGQTKLLSSCRANDVGQGGVASRQGRGGGEQLPHQITLLRAAAAAAASSLQLLSLHLILCVCFCFLFLRCWICFCLSPPLPSPPRTPPLFELFIAHCAGSKGKYCISPRMTTSCSCPSSLVLPPTHPPPCSLQRICVCVMSVVKKL